MDLREIEWGWYGVDSSGSGYGPVECSCEHDNKLSGSIKCREILVEKLSDWQLLKDDSAPHS
jgi:hypothetical protein